MSFAKTNLEILNVEKLVDLKTNHNNSFLATIKLKITISKKSLF